VEEKHGASPMPFPLGYLKFSDEKFANEVAGTSVDEFEEFKKNREVASRADKNDSSVGENSNDVSVNDGNIIKRQFKEKGRSGCRECTESSHEMHRGNKGIFADISGPMSSQI